MRKISLLLLVFIIFKANCQSERDIFFLESVYQTYLPIINKEGKKEKLRESTVKFYTIILRDKSIGDYYSRGAVRPTKFTRYVGFTKYIEEYKQKRIKEVLFETKPTDWSVSKKDITVTKKINLFNSTTKIDVDFCGYIDTRYIQRNNINIPSLVFDLKKIGRPKLISKKYLKISQKNINHIYELIGKDSDLIKALKSKQITDNGVTDLIELKQYIEKKYSDKFKYKIENKKLKEELRSLIPRISNVYGDEPTLRIYSYVDKNGVKFNLIMEHFSWVPVLNRGRGNKIGHLEIEYPKDSEFAGKVYLKMLNGDRNANPFLAEVYKSYTKNKVPYNKLVINTSSSKEIKIYGLKGSYDLTNYYFEVPDNEYLPSDLQVRVEYLSQEIHERIPSDYKPKLGSPEDIIFAKVIAKKGSLIEKFNEDKLKNYYLKWAIKTRPAFISKHIETQKERDLADLSRGIEYYSNNRNISLQKNDFYLENALIEDGKIKERIGSKLVKLFTGEKKYVEEDLIEVSLLNEFMRAKAKKCPNDIPLENKTPIYDVGDCLEWYENANNGNFIRCTKWNKKPSGLYTSKELFNAYLKVGKRVKSLKGILNTMSEMNENKKRKSILKTIEKNKKDIQLMFELNNCGKAIERFEKNLVRSVNGEKLIKLN